MTSDFAAQSSRKRSLLRIHIAVFLFGLAGLLGKLITATPLVIVFGRSALGAIALGALLFWRRRRLAMRPREVFFLAASGAVLAVHWWSFFQSVKLSSVGVALLTFASFPLFVTFLEPLFFRHRVQAGEFIAALLVSIGLALVVPGFHLDSNATIGAGWGLVSGFTFAILALLNRRFARQMSSVVIAAGQNAAAALLLLPWVCASQPVLSRSDGLLIAGLGLLGTAVAHVFFIEGLARVRAQTAAIMAALEPVYGIVLALVVLGEVPSIRMLAGGAIIICTATWISANRTGEDDPATTA